jgi:hypothetical protein
LQIFSEWGIVLGIFSIILIIKQTLNLYSKKNIAIGKTLFQTILILIIASFALSLNNSRVLWLILGISYSKLEMSIK